MSGNSLNAIPQQPAAAGYFGKIPARGDFLSRGLPREFVDPWDDWVQLALKTSREQLSESWLDCYLTSPVWQFALAPAVCGQCAWTGVLMPSVDAIGRYFPLTIAGPLPANRNVVTVISSSQGWLSRLEELARSCLDDGFDLGVFDQEMQALEPPFGQIDQSVRCTQAIGGDGLLNAWRYALGSPGELMSNCPELLRELMERLFFTYSLWWTAGSARVAPTSLICQGLPPADGFSAMLDGEWRQWGWEDKQTIDPALPSGEE